ncbi:MAG: hypothetical protein K5918_08785, partial [Bacteroidales bacterium]|nr:hypothetical protein [Bacteroidales bacterium]
MSTAPNKRKNKKQEKKTFAIPKNIVFLQSYLCVIIIQKNYKIMLKKLFKIGMLAGALLIACSANAQEKEYTLVYPQYGFWSNW